MQVGCVEEQQQQQQEREKVTRVSLNGMEGGRGAGFVKIFELEQALTGRHQITPIATLAIGLEASVVSRQYNARHLRRQRQPASSTRRSTPPQRHTIPSSSAYSTSSRRIAQIRAGGADGGIGRIMLGKLRVDSATCGSDALGRMNLRSQEIRLVELDPIRSLGRGWSRVIGFPGERRTAVWRGGSWSVWVGIPAGTISCMHWPRSTCLEYNELRNGDPRKCESSL